MKNDFFLPIKYKNKTIEVKIQCLSNELPNIIYVVCPKDEELIKKFENVKQFYFHINSKFNNVDNILEITNYVVYDYKTQKNKIIDIEFEFGVWSALMMKDFKHHL